MNDRRRPDARDDITDPGNDEFSDTAGGSPNVSFERPRRDGDRVGDAAGERAERAEPVLVEDRQFVVSDDDGSSADVDPSELMAVDALIDTYEVPDLPAIHDDWVAMEDSLVDGPMNDDVHRDVGDPTG